MKTTRPTRPVYHRSHSCELTSSVVSRARQALDRQRLPNEKDKLSELRESMHGSRAAPVTATPASTTAAAAAASTTKSPPPERRGSAGTRSRTAATTPTTDSRRRVRLGGRRANNSTCANNSAYGWTPAVVHTPESLRRRRPRGQTAPRDPTTAPLLIEIAPGVTAHLRGSQETYEGVANDFYRPATCDACQADLCCILDASYLLCPKCRSISSLVVESNNSHNDGRGGIGMGFTVEELSAWQTEILAARAQGRADAGGAQRRRRNSMY